MIFKNYGIFNKCRLEVRMGENTKNSKYFLAVSRGAPLKKFATREQARAAKKRFKNPQQYAIVSLPEFAVVR